MTKAINADMLAQNIKQEITNIITLTKQIATIERNPKLAIITATDNKASHKYVANEITTAKEYGINAIKIEFDSSVTTEELEAEIERLNNDSTVDGIILQLPIYDHLDSDYLLNIIDFDKDVNGLTLMSKAFLENDELNYLPCTAAGIILLLESVGIRNSDLTGKNVVIIGRSKTSGAPISVAFRHLDTNVTTLHSKTKPEDLEFFVRNADIVISCVGKRYLLKADWFKEDSIVMGVSFQYDESGKQHLDFEVDKVIELGKAAFVTQRTNCTGKATVISLMYNTALSYARLLKDQENE